MDLVPVTAGKQGKPNTYLEVQRCSCIVSSDQLTHGPPNCGQAISEVSKCVPTDCHSLELDLQARGTTTYLEVNILVKVDVLVKSRDNGFLQRAPELTDTMRPSRCPQRPGQIERAKRGELASGCLTGFRTPLTKHEFSCQRFVTTLHVPRRIDLRSTFCGSLSLLLVF